MQTFFQRQRLSRAAWLGLLAAWLAGIYLVLAVPLSLPGGAVERVQANLAGFNLRVLASSELGSSLLVLAAGAAVGSVIFFLVRYIQNMRPGSARVSAVPGWAWLLYALPMLLAWGFSLLVFWPAVMSSDSIVQWRQASTGQFFSGHPLGHTLFLWLLKQIWDTPTFVALVQIAALASLVGWELAVLRRRGLPAWAAWGTSALFALSPVNNSMVITIWKDIPYSTALFALSLLVLNISMDEAQWLKKKGMWLALGAACAGISLFRHNGFLIALLVPLLLGVIFRRHWPVFGKALLFTGLCWAFVQWPLDTLMRVEKGSIITGSIALHHIGAHVKAGTLLTAEEQELIGRVLPLDQWDYSCYGINPIQNSPLLNVPEVVASTDRLYAVMGRLFLRSPTVDIRHMLCAGEVIYRVFQPPESYLFASHAIMTANGPRYLTSNDLGLKQDSRLPEVSNAWLSFMTWSGSREVNWFIWRPALWLYLLLLIGCGVTLRWGYWKGALFLLPALIQTSSLFLTNISQSFRYQYPIYLLGLFALALLFVPAGRSLNLQPDQRAGFALFKYFQKRKRQQHQKPGHILAEEDRDEIDKS